jgi:hypothetical protein
MDYSSHVLPPLKCALFVDFDNIYIALSKTDPQAAERFASDPTRWLSWLEEGHPLRAGGPAHPPRQRSILVRRCYPNPDAGFRRFRSFFTSAAFSVIDCPSMTHTGKNSSDIYMVMDILDTLNHKTYFDEFIILSGDSDFMPVLLRLRAHDRRTTTLNIDFMPPAFRAACDMVISEEEFIEAALGVSHEAGSAPSVLNRGTVAPSLLQEMALRVYTSVSSAGEVAGASLPEILKDFREFRDSTNWLGFGTSQRLAEGLAACDSRLQLVRLNPMLYKIQLKVEEPATKIPAGESSRPGQLAGNGAPAGAQGGLLALPGPSALKGASELTVEGKAKRKAGLSGRSTRLVGRAGPAETGSRESVEESATAASAVPAESAGTPPAVLKPELQRLREQILSEVKDMVTASPVPLLLARVSQSVVSRVGHQVIDTQWAGAGSFKRMLQGAQGLGLEVTTQPEPGYIFDPQRHAPPVPPRSRAASSARRKPPGREDAVLLGEQRPDYETYMLEGSSPRYLQVSDDDANAIFGDTPPALEEFIRRVSRVTGAPDLTPPQFAMVFHGIVHELQQIAHGEKTYHTYQSAKAISDWCAERGSFIARGDIMLILKGIIFQDGPRFTGSPGSYTARDLAEVVCANIKALCRRSQMECSEYENRLMEEWIFGCLEPEPPEREGAELEAPRPDQPE